MITIPSTTMTNQVYTIFVGDLSLFCNETHIHQAFIRFGEILAVRIAFDDDAQKQLPYGFVDFANLESATSAMKLMDGQILCGRRIRINWATNKGKDSPVQTSRKVPTPAAGDDSNTSSVHVIYLSHQCDALITEESLRSMFSKFGEVRDVMIKKSSVNKQSGMQKGYGFVHFANSPEGIRSTLSAVEELFDRAVDGVHYTCSVSHTCEKRLGAGTGGLATADAAARINALMGCAETLRARSHRTNGPRPTLQMTMSLDRMLGDGQRMPDGNWVQWQPVIQGVAYAAPTMHYAFPPPHPQQQQQQQVYTVHSGASPQSYGLYPASYQSANPLPQQYHPQQRHSFSGGMMQASHPHSQSWPQISHTHQHQSNGVAYAHPTSAAQFPYDHMLPPPQYQQHLPLHPPPHVVYVPQTSESQVAYAHEGYAGPALQFNDGQWHRNGHDAAIRANGIAGSSPAGVSYPNMHYTPSAIRDQR